MISQGQVGDIKINNINNNKIKNMSKKSCGVFRQISEKIKTNGDI